MVDFLQPDIVGTQAALLGTDVEGSCLFPCVLLHWVWSDDEQSMCEDNGEEW